MKRIRCISLAVALCLMAGMMGGCVERVEFVEGSNRIIPVEDTGAVVHNPDMGWVLYENYLISESTAQPANPIYGFEYEGIDNVQLKFTWADIEKGEGVYDFSEFDYIYDYWASRGKTIMSGMSTESLLWYGDKATGIPQYVLDQIPENQKQKRNEYGIDFWTVDASNEYYQTRLKAFLEACNAHFQDGRPMAIIDLRGFGMWGEWHTGYQYADLTSKRSALSAVLKIWSEAFPDTWLNLSYSYDPDDKTYSYAMPTMYEEFKQNSAYDIAAQYANITWRRDGAGGAIKANERTFCEEMFSSLSRGPFISEGAGGYEGDNPSAAAQNIVSDGLTLHPNYFTVVGWGTTQALMFTTYEKELFNDTLNQMGYRLVPQQVTVPKAVYPGEKLQISSSWVNLAVGRVVHESRLKLVLSNKDGDQVAEIDMGNTGNDKWIKNGGPYTITNIGRVPANLRPGVYNAELVLYDMDCEKALWLPLESVDGNGTQSVNLGTLSVSSK